MDDICFGLPSSEKKLQRLTTNAISHQHNMIKRRITYFIFLLSSLPPALALVSSSGISSATAADAPHSVPADDPAQVAAASPAMTSTTAVTSSTMSSDDHHQSGADDHQTGADSS